MTDSKLETIVIGAGASGILAGIKLREAGIENFVILERSHDVGGTWLDNIYPGAGCDIPAHLYSYSFAPNSDWTHMFASQAELLTYFRKQVDRFGLRPKISFDTIAVRASFDSETASWTVGGANGTSWTGSTLIVATGQLNKPHVPPIPGRESFNGAQFHSARWNYDVPVAGKRVGVVGCGASAVQFIPIIAQAAGELIIYQRTAPWVAPRRDVEYDIAVRKLLRIPLIRLALRCSFFLRLEALWLAIRRPGGMSAKRVSKFIAAHLDKQVRDPDLKAKLKPDPPVGCKRIVLSDDYYPALQRRNVTLETAGISEVTPYGPRLADGRINQLDLLIWATGFETHQFVQPLEIVGLQGQLLSEAWRDGPTAYRGVAVSGFPNMYMLYGPNSNFGHNSVIFMVEQQIRYIIQGIQRKNFLNIKYFNIKSEYQNKFNEIIQDHLSITAYSYNCNSWFKSNDIISNNWSGSAISYASWMENFDISSYTIVK